MKTFRYLVPVFFIIISIIFDTGCVTSKGDLFENTAASDTRTSLNKEEEKNPGLTIETNPSRADVYIDDSYIGISPLTIDLNSGNYRITVKIDGYYTTTEWINYTEGDNVSININLEPITGFLNISVSPNEAKLSTGGRILYESINTLPIGNHLIKAELFGYESWQQNVEIYEDKTSSVSIKMSPADFKIASLFLSRKAFNPENPGSLGKSKITFKVNTFGTGKLAIFSKEGKSILRNTFPYFDDWNQSFVWDGKDDNGNPMPNGIYRVVISGRDMDNINLSQKETYITIDRSLVIRIRTTLNGTSGLLYCPTPDTLPRGSFQIAASTFGHISENTYRFPFTVSARFIPINKLEIVGQAGIVIMPETSESFYFSGSAKSVIFDTKVGDMSWYIKGSYQNNHYTDRYTNFTGLSAGLPISISIKPITLIITPELILSPFRISYDESDYNTRFYTWGYGRAALLLDLGSAMLGISTAVRITPYNLEIGSNNPLSAGIELNWLIPGTGIFVTGIISGEFSSMENYYINAGGGIGLIN